jgi:hypothetical protein
VDEQISGGARLGHSSLQEESASNESSVKFPLSASGCWCPIFDQLGVILLGVCCLWEFLKVSSVFYWFVKQNLLFYLVFLFLS